MGNLVWNFVSGDTVEIKVCQCGLIHLQVGALAINFTKKDFEFFQRQIGGVSAAYSFVDEPSEVIAGSHSSNVIQGAFSNRAVHHHDSKI